MSARLALIAQIDATVEQMLGQANAAELEEQAAGLVLISDAIGRGEDERAERGAEVLVQMLEDKGWLAELPGWIRTMRAFEATERLLSGADGVGPVVRLVGAGEAGVVAVDGETRGRG